MGKDACEEVPGQNFLIDDNVLSRIVSASPTAGTPSSKWARDAARSPGSLPGSGAQFLAIEWDRDLLPF